MIRLAKKAVPAVLQQNAAAWTQTLLDHIAAGTKPSEAEKSRYRHSDVKAALLEETSDKCAYCESKLRHITYGDVEHIVPKSVEPSKTFEWSNLTLACDVCNTNKGDHFGNHEDLADPYATDPNDHFLFLGATILPRMGSGAGQATTSTLQLNRTPLLERRQERLHYLCQLLQRLFEVSDANMRAVLRRDIERHELSSDKEYAAMARSYVFTQLEEIDQRNGLAVVLNPGLASS